MRVGFSLAVTLVSSFLNACTDIEERDAVEKGSRSIS